MWYVSKLSSSSPHLCATKAGVGWVEKEKEMSSGAANPSSSHYGEKKHQQHATKPAAAATLAQQLISTRALIDSSRHDVLVGHGTVIHPKATIIARDGPIVIGDYCVVEEFCEIRNELGGGDGSAPAAKMVIGNHNHFCVRSEIRASKIGNENKFMPCSFVGIAATVGDHCIVQPYCRVSHDVALPSETVVYGGAAALWAKREHYSAQEEKDEMVCLTRALRSTMKA